MKSSALALATLLLLSACLPLSPPLELTREGETVHISVATLGEYPTSISRIRLINLDTNETVWELRARGSVPQIWGVDLRPGSNPSVLESTLQGNQYEVIVPAGQQSFILLRGRRYEIFFWNKEGSRRAEAAFGL